MQTLIPGYMLYLYDFGVTYLLFGPCFAVVYEVAFDIPFTTYPEFAQGTALAEFIWVRLVTMITVARQTSCR